MKNNYEEIINELEKAELSIKTAREILSISKDMKIITTPEEFEIAIIEVSKLLAKSENAKTVSGVKQRLLKLKKFPNVKEAYKIQEKFGIPIYAWKDIKWYQKSLTPVKREE